MKNYTLKVSGLMGIKGLIMIMEQIRTRYPLTYREELDTWERERYTEPFTVANILQDIRDGWTGLPVHGQELSDTALLEFCELWLMNGGE